MNIIKKEYFDIEPLICLGTDSKKTASSIIFVPDLSCSKICERVGYLCIRAAKRQCCAGVRTLVQAPAQHAGRGTQIFHSPTDF